MIAAFIILFVILLMFSAFFSSAETALLSANRIRLSHRAKQKNKKAQALLGLLEKPEDFFSTILIGNNLVNVAAATVATTLFTIVFQGNRTLILITETLATTFILLLFAEITPKSYAYRHAEKLSQVYTYPILFFKRFFYPFARFLSILSSLLTRADKATAIHKKELSIEEIQHFLSHETQLLQYSPEILRMVNEIIEITRKDLRAIMTPRTAMVALEESSSTDDLKQMLLKSKFSKIPIYHKRLDNVTGIIHTDSLLPALLEYNSQELHLKQIAAKPIFVSEYSSLRYVLAEFKKQHLKMAIVLDEYGAVIGLLTLSDILRETIGDLRWGESHSIVKLQKNVYHVKGSLPVEEINAHLGWNLPTRKEYTTISGLFIYHFGKLPVEKSRVRIDRYLLLVQRMGKRKIEEVIVICHEDHSR